MAVTWEPMILRKTEAQKEFIFADANNWLKDGASSTLVESDCHASPCAGVLPSVGAFLPGCCAGETRRGLQGERGKQDLC